MGLSGVIRDRCSAKQVYFTSFSACRMLMSCIGSAKHVDHAVGRVEGPMPDEQLVDPDVEQHVSIMGEKESFGKLIDAARTCRSK